MSKITKAQIQSGTVILDASAFDRATGETTARGGNVLKLEVGQGAGPFRNLKPREIEIDGETVSGFEAAGPDGATYGLPLSVSFANQIEELKVTARDTFLVLREPDAAKKKGKGKGRMMKIYRVKVVKRG